MEGGKRLPKVVIAAEAVKQCDASDDERREGHSREKEIQGDVRVDAEPINQALRAA